MTGLGDVAQSEIVRTLVRYVPTILVAIIGFISCTTIVPES